MNPHLQRGLLLYDQRRFPQAEQEFKQAILADSNDAHARAMLALCLSHQEKHNDAEQTVSEALRLDPTQPFVHYARAFVLQARHDFPRALEAIKSAIEIEPEEPNFRALQAQTLVNLKKWQEALVAAEAGLALDPEHVECTNLRAIALVKLGRKGEAGATIDAALARNPEDAFTHANQGWTLLHSGQHQKALEHFRESLRLDPDNEWARQGTIEALKARNIIYAMMLKYFLWMSRLSAQMQWGVILVGVFGMRALRAFGRDNPGFAPYVFPIQVVYLVFVFLTWTAEPLFNLLLRLNKFGRMVLKREEIVASNWVGAFVGVAVIALLAGILWESFFLLVAMVFGFTVLPLAAIFKCSPGWPRLAMTAYTVIIGGAGLTALLMPLAGGFGLVSLEGMKSTIGALLGIFGIGIILSGWIANFLMLQRVRK